MTMPREDENFLPSMVMNSEDTTCSGMFSGPNLPVSPPLEPWPLYASISDGQIWEWNVMLSLPMK